MIDKIEEWKIPVEGRLKDCFNLYFRVKQETLGEETKLNLRLRIERLVNNDDTKVLIKNVTSKIMFRGEEITTYKDLYFLGDNDNLILINKDIEINVEATQYIVFNVSLIVNDENNYIVDTNMPEKTFVISQPINAKKPVIYLDCSFVNSNISVVALTSFNYDLLEFKVNDEAWCNYKSSKVVINNTGKKQYIQARMKINNEYYYSKTLYIE